MNKTKIEWVKNPDGSQGYTWNPITGCLNGCDYCYARKLANTRLRERYLANRILPALCGCGGYHYDTEIEAHLKDPFYPRFWPEKLEELDQSGDEHDRRRIKPKGIFVCDMSDLFGIGVPTKWTESVMELIEINWKYRFYLLTNQPQNLVKFSPFPDNCWVGVTAITNAHLLLAIGQLEKIQARIKFLSLEPLLYELDGFKFAINSSIGWVIIGAQTKPYKPPERFWISEITEACKKAGIPYFLKDNLKPLLPAVAPFVTNPLRDLEFGLRQELPA